jgi:SAM-dependent methyltransferase
MGHELRELRENWDELGRTDPFWAILNDPDRAGARWDRKEFMATGNVEFDRWLDWFLTLGLRPRRRRALDFGCGAGRMSQAIARHFTEVVGVDVAPSMIELARELNDRPGVTFVHHDRPDLSPFPTRHFDLVYSILVLQHIRPEFTKRYLHEFGRVLAPGGVLAFQLPGARQTLPVEAFAARLELAEPLPAAIPVGARCNVRVRVTNTSSVPWALVGVFTVGNHWWRGDERLCWDDGRAWLPPLGPGETGEVAVAVTAPTTSGPVDLELDVVAEGIAWFGERGSSTLRVPAMVAGEGPVQALEPKPEALMEMHHVPPDDVDRILREAGLVVVGLRVANATPAGWTTGTWPGAPV